MRKTKRNWLVTAVSVLALGALGGCGDDETDPPVDGEEPHAECGGHGHLHGDHCHCDEGYETAADDEALCVPQRVGGVGGSGGTDACDVAGNLSEDELPTHGSVAFVLVGDTYRFLARPGMEDTSLSFIDSDCKRAYGWSRDLPIDDERSRESAWILDLETMKFTDVEIEGASWVVLRGARDDGTIVGKLAIDGGTPDDPRDDESRGFIHDLSSGETRLFARESYSDIGLTGINEEGVAIGFNDFGTQGFTLQGDEFKDLDDDDAYRLFPFAISSSGVIVGFWGASEETWYDNSRNPSFVAEPRGGSYRVRKYELEGKSGVGLTGLNDRGQIAGISYAETSSLPVVFRADRLDEAPEFFPLPGHLEPFTTGISDRGVVFGQVFLVQEPRPCGGHGTLEGGSCVCDEGFELDPHDSKSCLPPDAECSGHGHLHGERCHCEPGFIADPGDATACIPE